jgi:hypothetical protein
LLSGDTAKRTKKQGIETVMVAVPSAEEWAEAKLNADSLAELGWAPDTYTLWPGGSRQLPLLAVLVLTLAVTLSAKVLKRKQTDPFQMPRSEIQCREIKRRALLTSMVPVDCDMFEAAGF